jgi:hypothetical protein
MKNAKYINEDGNNVPENTIVVFSHSGSKHFKEEKYKEIIEDFRENPKRDWFTQHFYYCLPLLIGNQYGFGIKSLYNFTAVWDGRDTTDAIKIDIEDYPENDLDKAQIISSHFGHGIITLSNYFILRTEPGMNLMIMPPSNHFIPNLMSMTGVVETDNIRRDFTFNLKILEPNKKVIVKKGDMLSSFIPIKRYFIDNFSINTAQDIFDNNTLQKETRDMNELSRQRNYVDPSGAPYGRKYFKGIHAFDEKFDDHQIKVKKP